MASEQIDNVSKVPGVLKVNEDALNMRFKHVESLKKHSP